MSSSSAGCYPITALHPDGRRPIGVAQLLGNEYPLVQPSSDIRYLLADAFFSYDDPADYDPDQTAWSIPFSIKWLYGLGCVNNLKPGFAPTPTHAADILLVDGQGATVFDSTAAPYYQKTVWSDRLDIHEWRSDTAVCRIVVHTKWDAVDGTPTPQDYTLHIAPSAAVLDARTIFRIPRRIRSVTVDAVDATSGTIEFSAGYNMQLQDAGRIGAIVPSPVNQLAAGITAIGGGRDGRRIELAAIPGAGLGIYPGCEDVPADIYTINNIPPNRLGNFDINAAECYWLDRPGTVTNPAPREITLTANGQLRLHNDCVVCCHCDDFVEVKKAIDRLYGKYRDLAQKAMQVRDQYKANRQRWLAELACRDADKQRLRMEASCGGFVSFVYTFCARSRECRGPLDVTFNITRSGTGTYDFWPGTIRKNNPPAQPETAPYAFAGSLPQVSAHWEKLDGMRMAKLLGIIRACDITGPENLTISATATYDGTSLGTITKSVALIGDCGADPCDDDDENAAA